VGVLGTNVGEFNKAGVALHRFDRKTLLGADHCYRGSVSAACREPPNSCDVLPDRSDRFPALVSACNSRRGTCHKRARI
jgi:hypothetical protein